MAMPLSVRRRPQFQSSSSLKPLGQSKPNFMWSILRKEEQKFILKGPGHMTKMAVMTINSKNLKKTGIVNISGVGEMGVGEMGVGEMGQIICETGVGETGTTH